MDIPNIFSPLSFLPSPDRVVVPLVACSTHVAVTSYFVGHAAHVASFAFLDAHVVPPDILRMLQLADVDDHIVNVAFVAATSFVAAAVAFVAVVCCIDDVVVVVGVGVVVAVQWWC